MFFLALIPVKVGGALRNNGNYDPIREKDRYYSKLARNPCEDDPNPARSTRRRGATIRTSAQDADDGAVVDLPDRTQFQIQAKAGLEEQADEDLYLGLMYRPLRPSKLCFLVPNDDLESPEKSFEVRSGEGADAYIFISYTRSSFYINRKKNIKPEPPLEWVARDRKTLLQQAIAAAKRAQVPAFWIDIEGISSQNNEEDVYRICDILRGAHSMVIINGSPFENKEVPYEEGLDKVWLGVWASRMWVLIELLLAPADRNILVYTQRPGIEPHRLTPTEYTKRDLALVSCKDALEIRHLIAHFDGNTLLTPLELVQLALRCLKRRGTERYSDADLAYALKGLLWRRPRTVEGESGFEAFASLSLVNDSQKLLERVLCTLSPNPKAEWYDMRDAWGMQLWDIEPSCQVAGVVDDNVVLLDGAHGASIRWERLERVAFVTRDTPFRLIAKVIVRGIPLWLISSLILIVAGANLIEAPDLVFVPDADCKNKDTALCNAHEFISKLGDDIHHWSKNFSAPFLTLAGLWCVLAVLIILALPYLLYRLYHGKFWGTQAFFFGIEGPIEDLADIERRLFGVCQNRLSWSTNGSLLSRHHRNEVTQERVADPPLKHNRTEAVYKLTRTSSSDSTHGDGVSLMELHHKSADSASNPQQQQRLFTLVDTFTLTVTQFYASHPPTAVFICGQEGGMQRAVLCSYDWKSGTWCKETVLRMKTLVLERMSRVDRFRFAMKRAFGKKSAD